MYSWNKGTSFLSLWVRAPGGREVDKKRTKRERTAATIHVLLLAFPPSLKLSCHFSSLHLGRLGNRVLRLPLILGSLVELGLG